MKNSSSRMFPAAVTRGDSIRQLGVLFLVGTASFLVACGSDQPQSHSQSHPKVTWPPPFVEVTLDAASYDLDLDKSVTVVAQVSGTNTPVTWTLDCPSGQASIVPNGNSATLTGLAHGTCFLWVADEQISVDAVVRILPLPFGDPCTDNSQCGSAAPMCRHADPLCPKTCTVACTTDADCPISASPGLHVPCRNNLCSLLAPDYACP